ncbi:large ribosomal subunit protein eL20z-like [Lycium barbarum]|uniref:large ribosomal subunit protein eL20z-like n=1 Tax=Lycium barbarum TaxID=112863 RepID=UPI00293F5FA9|nr:large ribosomal subunit protein eL20z-like [Lycium barbarum]XP_060187749.1 large ribosomal subunit protein eL20z-like [Lycium barbarum]XP_060187750.1 large ribosomal subunit protein eL20z-like [Lycium barbarum]XP_060187751.1 large ribosomal subunit protein eL20z-like [Lycium barbarum]
MSEEGKDSHHHHHGHHGHHHHEVHQSPPPPATEYGTFGQPPLPVAGFPQPVPPPGALEPAEYYARGYQAVPGNIDESGAVIEPPLPCCGIGLGWFMFITGFFLAAIPWYVAAFILLATRAVDNREKPGYVLCTIAVVLATIAIVFGLTKI